MPLTSIESLRKSYETDLFRTLRELRSNTPRIIVPPRKDLYSKQLKAPVHPYPEVFIQTGGATAFQCPGSDFQLEAGEICVMPRGLPHAEKPIDKRSPYSVSVIGISMGRLFFIRGRKDPTGNIHSHQYLHLDQAGGHELARYLDEMSEYHSLPPESQPTYILALLEAFLLRAHAALLQPSHDEDSQHLPLLIEKAISHVRIHLSNPELNVTQVARALTCTPDHLSRQFHRTMGTHMTTWITKERINLAKYLLDTSPQNIGEISWACGFTSTSYFIRSFKRLTGMTPKAYRHSHSSPR
ncbi:AraC family transcriptional regulator [Coraliomargarita parva]|uniref:AraC family transcriptional regulator n=1 Tax=Coraliomargarita parva TaxID=3014050 RepID=UPI0022B4D658|nr:helix-turn-helix domain-containing protein [Coraliomargarita parva]